MAWKEEKEEEQEEEEKKEEEVEGEKEELQTALEIAVSDVSMECAVALPPFVTERTSLFPTCRP